MPTLYVLSAAQVDWTVMGKCQMKLHWKVLRGENKTFRSSLLGEHFGLLIWLFGRFLCAASISSSSHPAFSQPLSLSLSTRRRALSLREMICMLIVRNAISAPFTFMCSSLRLPVSLSLSFYVCVCIGLIRNLIKHSCFTAGCRAGANDIYRAKYLAPPNSLLVVKYAALIIIMYIWLRG